MDVPVDGRREEQPGFMFTVHFQGLVEIAPLITGGVGRMNPDAPSGPDPADDRQQSVAMFIEHPDTHRLRWRARDFGEPGRQLQLELGRLRRIFLRVRLARHLQFASEAA